MVKTTGEEKKYDKAKQYITYLLQKHLMLTGDVQDEMFAAVKKEEEKGFQFFDTTNFERHATLSEHFISTISTRKAHFYLERAFTFWSNQMASAVFEMKDQQQRLSYAQFPKLIAAYLLIAGDYSKAVLCLAHAVRVDETDLTSRVLLLRWLCHLGEWALAKKQLVMEQSLPVISGSHYDTVMDIFSNLILINTAQDKTRALNSLVSIWDQLNNSTTKTFMLYQCQALVKGALLQASRLPNADIDKTGDPLRNLEVEIARLSVLVKNRHQTFFNYAVGVEMQKRLVNPDEFLKLSSHIAEHMEACLVQCCEQTEVGVLRECEAVLMTLWRQSIRLGAFTRTLVVVNLLMMLVLLSKYKSERVHSLKKVVAALLNSPKQQEKHRVMKEIQPQSTPSKTPSSTTKMLLHAFCYGGENETEEEKRSLAVSILELHSEKCNCMVCAISKQCAHFQLEILFAHFLFNSFSSRTFQLMALRFRALEPKFEEWRCSICTVIGVKLVDIKSSYPLPTRDLFLRAAARWLRGNGETEKKGIRDSVIHEAIKMCEVEPCHHRWQWLTIRQLQRDMSLDHLSDIPWISVSSDGLDIPLGMLAEDFNAMSLQTPRRTQPRKTPRSTTKTPLSKPVRRGGGRGDVSPNNCSQQILDEAKSDFEQYSHLFYREWRHLSCSGMAQVEWRDSWNAAFVLSEATCLATRQLARTQEEEGDQFRYTDVRHFKRAVRELPEDISVVQLFVDASRVLWLVRLHAKRTPLVLPLVKIHKDDEILVRMEKILEENNASGKMAATCTDAKKFWALRRKLDKDMETVIKDAESTWLREFSCLLLPCRQFTPEGLVAVSEIAKRGFNENTAQVLVEMSTLLSITQWKRLCESFAILDQVKRVSSTVNTLCRLNNSWQTDAARPLVHTDAASYSLLAIAPELASFPFEMSPILEDFHKVCRITSLYFLQRILNRVREMPKCVDGRNSYYVLDPGGDLAETQNRLAQRLKTISCWKGIIGQSPDCKLIKDSLENNDLFFYMGHGSGGRYFGKSTIRKTSCRAVSVLMGCSSARTTHEGDGLDGRNAIYDYSVARCPCVVGCLWMVTDGEIDRFFLAMLSYCFSDSTSVLEARSKQHSSGDSYRLLIDALAYARTACKLRYMTGAAVVSYGLPVMSANLKLISSASNAR